jgi:hypothetical protein
LGIGYFCEERDAKLLMVALRCWGNGIGYQSIAAVFVKLFKIIESIDYLLFWFGKIATWKSFSPVDRWITEHL